MTLVLPTYPEAAQSELRVVGIYRDTGREVKLSPEAAVALRELTGSAQEDGVRLVPISGFRTVKYQEGLFQKAVAKYGSEEAAARWVARPGHSEHHTGLAVDLGDETSPSADVEPAFEEGTAFRWLQTNAARFGFELSFPRNNLSGVNYEPWHWRFVGTLQAKQILGQ
ncbi:MAG: D-alanyl-D-alanine carboxypeptidase family protein [Pedosphaera sp.]|nr:D-alanyl-D-alanine carboxypeptidase family protein [Pedosphaera sp.]